VNGALPFIIATTQLIPSVADTMVPGGVVSTAQLAAIQRLLMCSLHWLNQTTRNFTKRMTTKNFHNQPFDS
jgi:hypothetical protein